MTEPFHADGLVARALLAVLALLSAGLLALDVAPAFAPGPVAAASRLALATTCHQRAERSLAVDGMPLASCARCTGLHAGGLVAALAGVALGVGALRRREPLLRRLVVASAAALGADALAGMAWGWDVPLLRLATGLAVSSFVACWAIAALAAPRAAAVPEGLPA